MLSIKLTRFCDVLKLFVRQPWGSPHFTPKATWGCLWTGDCDGGLPDLLEIEISTLDTSLQGFMSTTSIVFNG